MVAIHVQVQFHITIQYITLHYITLQYITLHYITGTSHVKATGVSLSQANFDDIK